VRLITLLTLPVAALFFVTSRPMVGALLQHGNFTAEAAHTTARALMGFSIGLVGFSVYLFVLRGFYAEEDTRTPFVVNCFENALNVVLAVALVGRYGVLGLGLAFGIAYLVSAVVALVVVERRHPQFESLALLRSLAPMLAATVPAAMGAWAIGRVLGDTAGIGAVLRIATCFLVGGIVYVAMLRALRVRETTDLVDRLRGFSARR
jgi:putative peptidoglycan lipid II flippase